MRRAVPVVDLFSGPGGLAEGFSALRTPSGRSRFPVALSVEKDPSACRTLRLRAFLRKFGATFPPEYAAFAMPVEDGGAEQREVRMLRQREVSSVIEQLLAGIGWEAIWR